MAKRQTKNNRRGGTPPRPPTQPRAAKKATPAAAAQTAEDELLEAQIVAESEGVEPAAPEQPPAEPSADLYARALADLEAAKKTYEALQTAAEEALETIMTDRELLAQERNALASDREECEGKAHSLDESKRAMEERTAELDAQREELARLQAEAEANFLSRRHEILGPVTTRIAELTTAWHEQELTLVTDWSEKLKERQDALSTEHQARLEQLTDEEQRIELARIELKEEHAAIARQQAANDIARQILDEDTHALEAERDSLIANARRESEASLRELETSRERLLARIDDLEGELLVLDEIKRSTGLDPERLVVDHRAMTDQIRTLETELSSRPDPGTQEELDYARQRLQEATEARIESERIQRELQSQLEYQQAQLEENERLKLSNTTLRASIGAYKVEIEEFRAQFTQLHADRQTESAFPECTKCDVEFGAKAAPPSTDVTDLEAFVLDLQIRMADDRDAREQGKRLNYRLSDLRILLAGLAMSRLHLLEGTSGTGKTTLPNAFANAVGGAARKIEVQAGWRDKQDLLGYYNSFERVYRESPCLQHLYKAGLAPFSDRIIMVVLDEMNLSHPEQYFADFLSALEDPRADALISISDRGLPHVPANMVSTTGVQLRLPPNVWFVGTANQDETTFAFAPKTYDRSHVMELEPNAPAVPMTSVSQRSGPVSVASLRLAFQHAEETHQQQTLEATKFVHGLAPFFNEKFRVGWGNRLDLHIARFVPVDISAGGSLGEALDHIMATKVLRKIQGRHSIRPDALEELAALVDTRWPDPAHRPGRTLAAIAAEIDDLRLG